MCLGCFWSRPCRVCIVGEEGQSAVFVFTLSCQSGVSCRQGCIQTEEGVCDCVSVASCISLTDQHYETHTHTHTHKIMKHTHTHTHTHARARARARIHNLKHCKYTGVCLITFNDGNISFLFGAFPPHLLVKWLQVPTLLTSQKTTHAQYTS